MAYKYCLDEFYATKWRGDENITLLKMTDIIGSNFFYSCKQIIVPNCFKDLFVLQMFKQTHSVIMKKIKVRLEYS